MTMALAVALVACSGAVGKTGETGPQGEPGDPAPPAPPVNLAPFSNVPFDPIVLVEEGEATVIDDLNAYFHDPEGQTLTFAANAVPAGVVTAVVAGSSLTVEAVDADITEKVTATITVTATDTESSSGTATIAVTVHPEDMAPARYVGSLDTHVALMPGQEHKIEGSDIQSAFEEDEEENLDYSFSVDPAGDSRVRVTQADDNSFTITALAGNLGDATVTIIATDEDNLPSDPSYVLTVSVVESFDPVPVGTIPTQELTVGGGSVDVDVSPYFSDPAGDDLIYTATSSLESVATADAVGSVVTIIPVGDGSADVTVTATNSRGLSATRTISVTVDPAPVVVLAVTWKKEIPDVTFEHDGAPQTIMLANYFNHATMYTTTDEDGTVVEAAVNADHTMLTLTRVGPGTATVEVTPSNSRGDGVAQSITVTVESPPPVNMKPTLKMSGAIPMSVKVTAITQAAAAALNEATEANRDTLDAAEKNYNLAALIRDPDGPDADLVFSTETTDPKIVAVYETPPDGIDTETYNHAERGMVGIATLDKMMTGASDIMIRGRKEGVATVTIKATDDEGAYESWRITVTVATSNVGPSTQVSSGEDQADGSQFPGAPDAANNDFHAFAVLADTGRLKSDASMWKMKLDFGAIFDDPNIEDDDALASGTTSLRTRTSVDEWSFAAKSSKTDVVKVDLAPTNNADKPEERYVMITRVGSGTSEITLTAEDSFGMTAEHTFMVRVNSKPLPYSGDGDARKSLSTEEAYLAMVAGFAIADGPPNTSAVVLVDDPTTGTADTPETEGYFSDKDGDALLCRLISQTGTSARFALASRNTFSLTGMSEGTLSVSLGTGVSTFTVRCFDQVGDSDYEWVDDTLTVDVKYLQSIH